MPLAIRSTQFAAASEGNWPETPETGRFYMSFKKMRRTLALTLWLRANTAISAIENAISTLLDNSRNVRYWPLADIASVRL